MARPPERRRDSERRRRPRLASDRRRSEDRRAFQIIGACVATIIGLIGLGVMGQRPDTDRSTGCISGQVAPAGHTLVLVDQTDALTVRQIDYVKSLILAEYQGLREGDRLTVRALGADPDARGREWSRCRVRRGADASGVTDNPEMIEADFRRIVGDPLNSYLDGLARQPQSETSPILESVNSAFDAPDFGGNVDRRRLIVVSDLAQHSRLNDQYADDGDRFGIDPAARRSLARDMRGVDVRLHYVPRRALVRLQTDDHRRFWRQWFTQQGANVELGWGLQMAPQTPAVSS